MSEQEILCVNNIEIKQSGFVNIVDNVREGRSCNWYRLQGTHEFWWADMTEYLINNKVIFALLNSTMIQE